MPGPMDYTILDSANDTGVAGMMNITPEMGPMPPAWVTYFCAANVDASAEKVVSLGGKIMVRAQDIPAVGRFSWVQDPQGAVFSLFTPANPEY